LPHRIDFCDDAENEWLDKPDILFMTDGEVRKGKWSFLADMT